MKHRFDRPGGDAEPAAPRETRGHATAFRSTWIVSSIEGLRAIGRWEAYLGRLSDHRDAIVSATAGAWLPIEVARAHYLACDALCLSSDEIAAMHAGAGGQVRRAWYASFIARASSATDAHEALLLLERTWGRTANGGAVTVARRGATSSAVSYTGCALFDIPYFAESVRAVIEILAGRVASRPSVRRLPQGRPSEARYVVEWRAD